MSGQHPAVHRDPALPRSVTVYEVGARDGLQAESALVPSVAKIDFIRQLRAAGLPWVEATSFVSPRRVPQLADAAEVMAGLGGELSAHPVLVPNRRGLERARLSGARAVAVFVSATETFARRNLNAGRDESLEMARRVIEEASGAGMRVRGYVSMCFGDPWEGEVAIDDVVSVSRSLVDSGCAEISLGDTIGVGTAGHVTELIAAHGRAGIGPELLALHFHDTYGQALANAAAGLRSGVTCFDASAGGIGGCPFAGSATGNLATEDLLWMLSGLGIETGVDLDKVVAAGAMMTDLLGRPRSRVATAMLG
ncbi:hydroxymethylglutaryl-CoA lyase [Aeromicrobium sp. PE09-221]|uniref:hydroxymethylglutaryl-CoA lyase n=1 Tax=Aeromicrobium sp. PE09-221 TaxID=1898043 RepID=UPI000B3E6433|nr:hydroxymethylglutaryl-CoA lyase [Aeromicrobium sp. PE09-221]OUZ08602.1 hydroxymethylglutaryl-CoA lyase [Aeromicrobium sp. PE09-221]